MRYKVLVHGFHYVDANSAEEAKEKVMCDKDEIIYSEEEIYRVDEFLHPVSIKTMLEDFFEKYPKATLEADGTPIICPHNLGYEKFNECDTGNCVECWNRSV